MFTDLIALNTLPLLNLHTLLIAETQLCILDTNSLAHLSRLDIDHTYVNEMNTTAFVNLC